VKHIEQLATECSLSSIPTGACPFRYILRPCLLLWGANLACPDRTGCPFLRDSQRSADCEYGRASGFHLCCPRQACYRECADDTDQAVAPFPSDHPVFTVCPALRSWPTLRPPQRIRTSASTCISSSPWPRLTHSLEQHQARTVTVLPFSVLLLLLSAHSLHCNRTSPGIKARCSPNGSSICASKRVTLQGCGTNVPHVGLFRHD
jgi:hypothetical protein